MAGGCAQDGMFWLHSLDLQPVLVRQEPDHIRFDGLLDARSSRQFVGGVGIFKNIH